MKTLNAKILKPVQLTALVISLAFGTAALAAADSDDVTINGWQSSLAAEFVKLDTSGNGLLMPLEASKGKAFSKKTFAAADVDGDGTIDQNEYINYRVSTGAKDVPANIIVTAPDNNATQKPDKASSLNDEPVTEMVADNSTEMSQDSAEPKERTLGNVIDDSVITTKAKAAIFNTPDLKTLQISVETRKGEVLLSGFVDNEAAKMRAEEVVKNVAGVKSVKNSLEVKG